MLHGCHMSIVASQVPYASYVSYEYSGLPGSLCFMCVIRVEWPPRFLMLNGYHMCIVATQVPYASWMSYEECGHPGSLCFMDVI